jgi:hypothetical protein
MGNIATRVDKKEVSSAPQTQILCRPLSLKHHGTELSFF